MRMDAARVVVAGPADRTGNFIVRAAMIGAAMAGFLLSYWVWRGMLVIPFELPEGGITLDSGASDVRPWAPWWVVPSISALLCTLIWRTLAVRAGGISILRSVGALVLSGVAIFPICTFALDLGAIAQYVPAPPASHVLMVLPAIAAESIGFTVFNLAWHGVVLLPAAALLGLLIAGVARLVHSLL